jgi:FkbM family methyltransferase
MNQLKDFLLNCQAQGLQINTVYDIGANGGNWSLDFKNTILPNSEFILFEANQSHSIYLKNTGFKYFTTILSNPGRDHVEFYSTRGTGDSYYKENTYVYDNVEPIKLPCTTLDYIVKTNNLPVPNFIKIDTQGSELDILAGAETIINNVDLIYTECPILSYNTGAPSIQDYLDYFKDINFIPVNIYEIHRFEETMIQVDILFMKKTTKDQIFGNNTFIRL